MKVQAIFKANDMDIEKTIKRVEDEGGFVGRFYILRDTLTMYVRYLLLRMLLFKYLNEQLMSTMRRRDTPDNIFRSVSAN